MTTPRLPQLDELLSPARLLARLAAIADPRATLVGVTPYYLRWKPGTSALLGLRLSWQAGSSAAESLVSLYLGEGSLEAAEKAGTLRLVEPTFGPALARLDDALFLAFPNDRALRGLSAAADARRLVNRLGAVGGPFAERGLRVRKRDARVRALRWKPGRRAVLEVDLTLMEPETGTSEPWRTYVRVLPARELEPRLARWRAAAAVAAVAAPRVEVVDLERGWFATSAAPGRPLAGRPSLATERALGAALAALHAAPSPAVAVRAERDDLAAARRALAALADVAPDLAARARELSTRLASGLESLPRVAHGLTHGDLGADQILIDEDRVSLIDWDEAANGDPHADWASLIADLRGRGQSSGWAARLAEQSLARAFDAERLAWQLAAAEARRAVEALQRGRADWRPRALDVLAAAERALDARTGAPAKRAVPEPKPAHLASLAGRLSAVIHPALRLAVPGVEGRVSRVGAVWPEGEAGAIVRLERVDAPGPVVRWLRLGEHDQVFDFPADPALPALGRLLADGGFEPAGHRLGKRAALRERVGDRFLFLRPRDAGEKAFRRVSEAYQRLERAGVDASRPLGFAPEHGGWWAEAVSGRTLEPAGETPRIWQALGALLARAHMAETPRATAPAGASSTTRLAAAVNAARKQISLVRLADPAFADELDRDVSEVPVDVTTGRLAWIHGDLHPLQILVGRRLVVLDWERSRPGDAEEDLGNFLAHLAWDAWDSTAAPREAWSALLAGYDRAGGEVDSGRLQAYARASLARVRAVHGWRDGSRERARDGACWRARWQEMATW